MNGGKTEVLDYEMRNKIKEFEIAINFFEFALKKLDQMKDFNNACDDYCFLYYLSGGLDWLRSTCSIMSQENRLTAEERNLFSLALLFLGKSRCYHRDGKRIGYRESRILLIRYIQDNMMNNVKDEDKKQFDAYDAIKEKLYEMIGRLGEKYSRQLRADYQPQKEDALASVLYVSFPDYAERNCRRTEQRAVMEHGISFTEKKDHQSRK